LVHQIWANKPNANYGIDLGRSNLTVLDFDNGRPPAELNLPVSFQVSTSRGTRVYFAGTSKQGKVKLLGETFGDTKSGGGYVLGPGCIHPDGPTYTVVVDAPIAAVPSLDALRSIAATCW
jgi:putative DNA primase/helicase